MTRRGFTLIELLIVVSIVLIAVGVAGELIISIIRSYNKTRILNEIEQNGNFAITKISYDLKNAVSLDTSLPSNSIQVTDQSGNTILYEVKNVSGTGAITRSVNAGTSEPMTNNDLVEGVNVTCNGNCFEQVSLTPLTVRVSFDMKQGPSSLNNNSKSLQSLLTFDTIVVMRGASQ